MALVKCPKQLSKEFGCHYTSIKTWCRVAGVPIRPNQAIASAAILSGLSLNVNERQELMELRKKLKRVEMKRNILVKVRPGLQTTKIDWEGVRCEGFTDFFRAPSSTVHSAPGFP